MHNCRAVRNAGYGMKATLIGVVGVLVWGLGVPSVRYFIEQLGLFAAIGFVHSLAGILGLIRQLAVKKFPRSKSIFLNPYLYGRWFCYVFQTVILSVAIALVNRENLPL